MNVKNKLLEKSFDYRNNSQCKKLSDCIKSLNEIHLYIERVNERMYFENDILYKQEIIEGKSLADWIFGCERNDDEYEVLLREILSKPSSKEKTPFNEEIEVVLYPYEECVSSEQQYIERRRTILSKINDKSDFCSFLPSCFVNSIFSNEIKSGLNSINDFQACTDEIKKNLSVLNDEAVSVYKNNKSNLSEAYKILSSKLLECSPDPNNVKYLLFEFTDDYDNTVQVECSPHTKLIRKDSDLRIYFYWCHKNVGKGENVLIGRIGTHPY